jgi:hypothetical protein
MYADFDFANDPTEDGKLVVRLGINQQMWLGVYPEPVPDKPETYEDENRMFEFTQEELQNLVGRAKHQALILVDDAQNSIALERLGATYKDVHQVMSRKNDYDAEANLHEMTDEPYDASEDLAFLYNSASSLYSFVFEANSILNDLEG